ncbi:MAG: AAA family ATPase [Nitrospirae bacterium]|nr:AAA family ATPase [Nitrospirota bacterium]
MLKPSLIKIEITPEIKERLQPIILRELFEYIEKQPRFKSYSITVSQAKEILEATVPRYERLIADSIKALSSFPSIPMKKTGGLLHDWMQGAFHYFRGIGAVEIKKGLEKADDIKSFYEGLWNGFFNDYLLKQIMGSGFLRGYPDIEACDLLVECMKLWLHDISEKLIGIKPRDFSSNAFFLDSEGDLSAEIKFSGKVLHLRGRHDAVFLDSTNNKLRIVDYKFGVQGQIELQIAQLLLYMAIIKEAKGAECNNGTLMIFRPEEDAAAAQIGDIGADHISEAFKGFIGNDAAVYQLKAYLKLALKEPRTKMGINIMLCGPGGLGKTELARRVANALGTPFVNISGSSIKDIDDIVKAIDETLKDKGIRAERTGKDSGKDAYTYPPFVLFIDEAHELKKKGDFLLNFLEPKERRAVCSSKIGNFQDATMLCATTDKGRLSKPFLNRFRIIDLSPYPVSEAAEIIKPIISGRLRPDLLPDEGFFHCLAEIGRLNPRQSIQKAEEFFAYNNDSPDIYPFSTDGLKNAARQIWKVNENGLTQNDMQYLNSLKDGPKGLTVMTRLLSVGQDEIENIIEPYLSQLGLIKFTASGRQLTEKGMLVLETAGD